METKLTVIAPTNLGEAKDLSSMLAASRIIPQALQKSPSDVLAIVLAGAELGFAPMQSVRALRLIKGAISMSADGMGALVKSRRDVCEYLILDKSTTEVATYTTKRVGDPRPTTMSFTLAEAKQAGLSSNDNYTRFAAAMLRARALSAICRAVYPDLVLGVYSAEELGEDAKPPQRFLERVEAREEPHVEPDPELMQQLQDSVDMVAPQPSPPREAQQAILERISACATPADLAALVPEVMRLPESARQGAREAWGRRREEVTRGQQ